MTIDSYQGFSLDPFQREAISHIQNNRSVIVSAPTGVGKTLVADFLVEHARSKGQKVIYTAPIKALSNQKYKEFKARFGEEQVGVVTGDVSINPRGDVLIMTTEIFRNMVLAQEPFLDEISHCIFDEIHYIDSERGVAWEESIIFAPPHIRILGLSATIGNLFDLVGWLSEVRQEDFAVVVEEQRNVPLSHYFFSGDESGKTYLTECLEGQKPAVPGVSRVGHLDLIENIKGYHLPALFFVFSRRQCSEKAREASQAFNLITRAELQEVEAVLERYSSVPGLQNSGDFRLLRGVLRKGVAYHHAGLLPVLKDMVEDLFAARLIKLLYCTETFSVGINYPVRTVCFDGQRKYDGRSVRPLKAQEYFQMSGRAGRRGMDEAGYVFTLLTGQSNFVENYCDRPVEQLNSQFRLTYNSVLNLLKYPTGNIELILKKSFAGYLSAKEGAKARRLYESKQQRLDQLEAQVCGSINDIVCPVTYQQRKRRLKTYEGLVRRSGGRNAAVKTKRDLLRVELSEAVVKDCPYVKRNNCAKLKKQYNAALAEAAEARALLKQVPSYDRFVEEYQRKLRVLEKFSYVEGEELLARGEVGAQLYIQEILVTELIFAGVLEDLPEEELVALFLGIDYPWRKFDVVLPCEDLKLNRWVSYINHLASNASLAGEITYSGYVAPIGYRWARGDSLKDVLDHCNLDEGDVVSMLRREIDLLRQMRHAVRDVPRLYDKLTRCMNLIDRDLVRVVL